MTISALIAKALDDIYSSTYTSVKIDCDKVIINDKYIICWNRVGTITLFKEGEEAPLLMSSDLGFIVKFLNDDMVK